jgi:hypothetical protein
MEHRGVEYRVVQTIERGIWMWTVAIEPRSFRGATSGTEKSRDAAIATAEQAIDRWLVPNIKVAKVKLEPRQD